MLITTPTTPSINFNLFSNGNFGWTGMTEELRARNALDSDVITSIDQVADAYTAMPSQLTELMKRYFNFDEGWAFWTAMQIVNGSQVPPGPQNIGNCVAYAAHLVLCDLMAQEIFILGQFEKFFLPFIPWLYGAGRVYEGNNRIRGDGSNGVWQIRAVMNHGVLPSDLPGLPPGGPQCSSSVGRQWGSSKSVLDRWKEHASPFKIGKTAEINSFEDAKRCVVDLQCPFTQASSLWFKKSHYDSKYGITIYKLGGRAAHQTYCRGIFKIKGEWFAYIGNQWGANYHADPGRGFPRGGFIVTADTYDRFIKNSACYMYQDLEGRKAVLEGASNTNIFS
jgi:hypothetical protein